jgi:GDPmannose 4,6-dehydratase
MSLKYPPNYYRPSEVDILIRDATKVKNILGWEPRTKFEELVKLMAKLEFNKFFTN